MAALDNIASELIKSANEADLIYKKTRDQAQLDKAVRLRRIVENLLQLSGGTATLDQVTTAGNTTANTINVGGITSDYFQLDTAATPTLAPGMFAWNDAYGTADLRLKGNNVTLQVGQETLARVVNKTGADLLESQYKVVRVRIASEGGAQGQRLAVVLAQGNNDPDSATTLGIVTEDIPNNQEGFITIFGNVNNINTTGSLQGETWVDGDVLYLSPTIPGAITKVKPVAPQHTVIIGYVVYAHNNQGKIFVKVDNGYELDELHNVLITSPANNDLLQYNSTQQVWKNIPVGTAVPTPTLAQVTTAGNTTTNAIEFSALNTRVSFLNPELGTRLNGIHWANGTNTVSYAYLALSGSSGEFKIFSNASYFPTFYSNGSEAMRIPTSRNVLIGTTTDAGYKLDVNGTTALRGTTDVIGGTLRIASTGTLTQPSYITSHSDGGWNFTTYTHNRGAGVHYFTSNNGSASIFSASAREGVNINVNSLTTGNPFSISGTVNASSAIARGQLINTTLVAAANNDVLVGLDINPTFTNGAFTGVENVGLRITSATPIFRLDSSAIGSFHGIEFRNTGSIDAEIKQLPSSGEFRISNGRFAGWNGFITLYTDTIERMRIRSNGNVLIGTTTDAGYKLDVNGTSRFQGSVTNTSGGFISTLTSPTSDAFYTFTSGAIGFYTSHAYTKAQRLNLTNTTGLPSTPNNVLLVSGSITASSALAAGVYFNNTLVAAANNDVLVGLDIAPTFTNGAFTGVSNYGIRVQNSDILINGISLGKGLGSQNIYIGQGVGGFTNTGAGAMDQNVFIGQGVGVNFQNNSNGHVAIGFLALKGGNNAEYNVAVGMQSLANFTGQYNVAIGKDSGYDNTTGGFNTFVGFNTGRGITTGNSNTIIGSQVSSLATSLSNTVILSDGAGSIRFYSPSSGNVLIGTTTDAGYKLDVNGTIRSSGTNGLVLYDGTYGAKVSMSSYIFTIEREGTYGVSTYQFKYSANSDALYLTGLTSIVGIGGGDDAVMMSRNVYARHDAAFGFTTYGSTTKYKAIQAIYTDNNTSGVAFNYKTGGTDTEAMRITPTGNVGIGTTSPIYNLEVSSTGYTGFGIMSGANNTAEIGFQNRGYGLPRWTIRATGAPDGSSGTLTFQRLASSFDLTIESTGNVLIGTTTDAGYKLDVNGSARVGSLGLYGNNGTITAPLIRFNGSNKVNVDPQGYGTVTNDSLITGNYILASSGGIRANGGFGAKAGTSVVSTPFMSYGISRPDQDASINALAGMGGVHDGASGWYQGLGLVFYTSNGPDISGGGYLTEKMRLSSVGNLGLGTTNPTDKFHIVDNTNGNKFARISAGGTDASAAWVAQNDQVDNIVYRVFGSAVTGSQMGQALARSASLIANLGGTGKFLIGSYSGTDLIFGTSDQARMRLVDATGNFLIGTMTDNGNKLTVSGNIDAQGYKVNNVLGYTGILNIPTNPPGQQNIDIQGGIVINIF